MNFVNTLTSNLGWIVGTILIFLAFLGSLRYAASRYKKVPPSRMGLIFGRKHKYEIPQQDGASKTEELGFRLLTNGGAVVYPFVEDYAEMSLAARLIPLKVADIPTNDKVTVAAEGVATVVIGNDMPSMVAAARYFEGKEDEEINRIIKENLEGQLRSILGTLSIEQLIGDREKLNRGVLEGAESELLKLGMRVTILTIQNISDKHGYIEALGKGKIAEVKRDASVREAEATRDSQIASSNAKKEAETVAAENEVLIAAAKKERDLKIAEFKALTDKENAKADQAGALAAAGMDRQVRQAKVEAEAAETQSRIALAEQETLRVEKELQFKQIKPAEAARQAAVIQAEADKQAGVIKAEQDKEIKVINAHAEFDAAAKQAEAITIKAEADATAAQRRGEGAAAAEKAVLVAKAEGKERDLVAEANGQKAKLIAVADGERARLLAEAEGKEKLAEALKKLDETGKLLQVLDQIPEVSEAIGKALAKALGPEGFASVFGQIAAPMGNIDSVRIYDFGGNGNGNGHMGNGAGAVAKLANVGPEVVFNLIAKAQSLGLGGLLDKIGLNSDILDKIGYKNPGNPEPQA